MSQLTSELLRTFYAIAQTGSVTDGAARIFRSQSAASLQIKKLESILGQSVFERHGRGVILTAAGERLLPVARDIGRTLDATLRELTSTDLYGKVRLGIPDDESNRSLSAIVAEFAQSHPLVELEVYCALSAGFPAALASGSLDLAIYEVAAPDAGVEVLRTEQTYWLASRHRDLLAQDPLPVALFDRDCWWRDAALAALQATGRGFRVCYSSQSVAGVAAAIEAGIAIGLLGESSLTPDLRRLSAQDGFSATPASHLVLDTRADTNHAPIEAMARAVRRAFGC